MSVCVWGGGGGGLFNLLNHYVRNNPVILFMGVEPHFLQVLCFHDIVDEARGINDCQTVAAVKSRYVIA